MKLQAKKIAEAIKRAQQVGEVEESFSLGDCEVTLRSLRPDEYAAALDEAGDYEDVEYLNAYKFNHLSRSVIEFNGASLRGYDFIEVDVEEFDAQAQKTVAKTITLERHKFVHEYVLGTWGREAIDVAWRKFMDVMDKANTESLANVTFRVPEETEEEKYRRLLTEARDLEAALPVELVSSIRDDLGYYSKKEREEVEARLERLRDEDNEPKQPSALEEQSPAPQAVPKPAPVPEPAPDLSAILRRPQPTQPPSKESIRKSEEIAKLEGVSPQPTSEMGKTLETAYNPHDIKPQPRRAVEEVKQILDKPPQGGINPRFKPPPRI